MMEEYDLNEVIKQAVAGEAEAQFQLGVMCYLGQEVTQDYTKAMEWYQKAAEQGHARAQCYLAYMYENELAVESDYMEAVKWYRKAAEQGLEEAEKAIDRLTCE